MGVTRACFHCPSNPHVVARDTTDMTPPSPTHAPASARCQRVSPPPPRGVRSTSSPGRMKARRTAAVAPVMEMAVHTACVCEGGAWVRGRVRGLVDGAHGD